MADIFQAYFRDDDRGEEEVLFEVMSWINGLWYHDCYCPTLEEAQEAAASSEARPHTTGVLIDRVTRQMVERRKRKADG